MPKRGIYPEFYPNLSGSVVELKDGLKNKRTRLLSGKKVLLLGTATDGPVLENVNLQSYQAGEDLFGRYYNSETGALNGATLTRGLDRLLGAGADNVDLMRISGKKATGEIELEGVIKEFTHSEREFFTADGNGKTTIDVNLPKTTEELTIDGVEYDYAFIDNVSVFGGGRTLSTADYQIDNDAGEVIINEDVTSSLDDIDIQYELIYVNVLEISPEDEEIPEQSSGNEYKLVNSNIVPGTEIIEVDVINGSTKELDENEYSIDYRAGLITVYNMDNYSGINNISYQYKETISFSKIKSDKANGIVQRIYLSYTADASREIVVTVNGEDLPEKAFDVSYNEYNTSVVYLKPGYADLNSDIYIKYYWTEEKLVKPSINIESIFAGDKYNDVKIDIIDKIVEKTDRYYESKSGELVSVEDDTFKFPDNDTNIFEDSVYIEDSNGDEVLAEDITIHAGTGTVIINDSAAYTAPYTVNYAVLKEEQKQVTVVRGEFDPTVNNDGENGGGMHEDMFLYVTADRKTVKFKNGSLVKDYFKNNPDFIQLVDESQSTETNLADTEKTYVIDYANGLIKFNQPLEVFEKIKVKQYEYYNVASKNIKIYKPDDKYINNNKTPIVIENIGPEITTVGQFINVVNSHPRNNVIKLSIDNEYINLSALDIKTPDEKLLTDGSVNFERIRLFGGNDEINLSKEELYDKLGGKRDEEGNILEPGAYDIIMDLESIDIVVPLGVYADDKMLSSYKSFASQLANFCSKCFIRNNEIRGVIGVKPLTNPSQINKINRISKLTQLDTDFYMYDDEYNFIRNRDNKRIDIGKYISIIGYDKVYSDDFISVPSIESGAVDFAAIASMVGPESSPTNEPTTYGRLAYNYSTNQASQLVSNKIVPAKITRGVPKILDSVTCAQPGSGWTRYFTVDIVFDSIDLLRDVFDKYIGKSNTLEHRASLNSDIRDALKKKATLIDYDYNVMMDPNDASMGRLIIELDLVPAGELQKIKTVVSINASLQQ